MDTSKEYIKMCEKAVEMQKQFGKAKHPIAIGDVYMRREQVHGIYFENVYTMYPPATGMDAIWLPRQDQLQEMVKDETEWHDAHFRLLRTFYYWVNENITKSGLSMEQLWLAFVMKEKYGKTWDGECWEVS